MGGSVIGIAGRPVRATAAILAGGLAWLGGCSASTKEGVTIVIELEAPTTSVSSTGARELDTDRGVHVVLTRALLTTGSVEVFACGAPSADWLAPWRMRRANAHVEGSPTLLGVPSVESLNAPAKSRTKVGELRPPPGAYCKVKHTILPADQDAPGLPPDGTMVGLSMLVEGTYVLAGGAAQRFRFASTASFDVVTTVDAPALSADGRRVMNVVLVKTNERWFDRVDFTGDETDATTRVLENLRSALGARVE